MLTYTAIEQIVIFGICSSPTAKPYLMQLLMVYNAAALPGGPSYRAEVMMIQMVLVLSVLGSYVVVMSDEVNLTATIPPGYALQDYLCSGPLKSNTTVVLDAVARWLVCHWGGKYTDCRPPPPRPPPPPPPPPRTQT